jgi:hypothetical protein
MTNQDQSLPKCGWMQAIIVAGVCEFLGAVLLGAGVTGLYHLPNSKRHTRPYLGLQPPFVLNGISPPRPKAIQQVHFLLLQGKTAKTKVEYRIV